MLFKIYDLAVQSVTDLCKLLFTDPQMILGKKDTGVKETKGGLKERNVIPGVC